MTMHEIDITNYMAPPGEDQQELLDQSVAFDPSDPFDEELVSRFLSRLETPLDSLDAYRSVDGSMPHFRVKAKVHLGQSTYVPSSLLYFFALLSDILGCNIRR